MVGIASNASVELPGFEERFAQVRGSRLRYLVRGEGEPLVLVHGLGGAASNWLALAPLLLPGRLLLVPELPGHGGSEPLPAARNLNAYADSLAALAEREGFFPAAVVGHSLGGWRFAGRIASAASSSRARLGSHPGLLARATRSRSPGSSSPAGGSRRIGGWSPARRYSRTSSSGAGARPTHRRFGPTWSRPSSPGLQATPIRSAPPRRSCGTIRGPTSTACAVRPSCSGVLATTSCRSAMRSTTRAGCAGGYG